VDVLIGTPLRALFPVAALGGAGLLSFARIIRLGAAMDEEIRATV
jgi:ABC-type Fe3+-siderophore transport system permease subunit